MSLGATELDDAEIRRAARALLAAPLLRHGSADFRLVRKHGKVLTDWFGEQAGWRLEIGQETARLFKAAVDHGDATRPARSGKAKVPFTRRRYVLLCLALAALERADKQTSLGKLAEAVLAGAADPVLAAAGIEFRMERPDERRDLVAVVRLLLEHGALHRVAGDEEAFVATAEQKDDVLYDVDRRVLAALPATRRGASGVVVTGFEQRITALTADPLPDTDELRLRSLRHRMTRRLLDDPVVYYDDLDDEERAYLVSQRQAICRRIHELTGLVPELRVEGVAMVDPDDELTDVRMPEQGTDGHVTLLVATELARRDGPVQTASLVRFVRATASEYAGVWRKTAAEPAAAADLVAQALAKLSALRLVVVEPGGDGGQVVTTRPALARYAVKTPTVTRVRSR